MAKKNENPDQGQASLDDFFGSSEEPPMQSAQQTQDSNDSPPDHGPDPVEPTSTVVILNNDEPTSEEGFEAESEIHPESSIESEEIAPQSDYWVSKRVTPQNLPPSFVLSIDYNGQKNKAMVRLYSPDTEDTIFWFDNTNHQPYCYTDLPPQAAEYKVKQNRGFVRTETVQLQDLLHDRPVTMTKVIANNPLAIGGTRDSIRELLTVREQSGDPGAPTVTINHAWEANIRYRNCYTYDSNIVPGMMYRIENGSLLPCPPDLDESVLQKFRETLGDDPELERIVDLYAPMFFTEVPDIKRIALDIEVYSPMSNRVPDANTAPYPVTAIGLSDNEGYNVCLVLKRKGHPEGIRGPDYPEQLRLIFYDDEKQMLLDAFKKIEEYPIVLTFVGDAFDLNYLYHRSSKLGIDIKRQCPIYLGRDVALLQTGVHVDLYKFLKNASIRLYALSGAYERSNLESIAQGLLGFGKLERSTEIVDLPYFELAHYCWLDANITLQITTFNDNLLLRLMVLLMRISRLSMEDVTRQGISSWIQSLFRQEHRSRKALIPRQIDIATAKGAVAQTTAMIKDKRFKGAIVIEPVPGVHFNTSVLDFASLYPTIMKQHNISYETVDCPHEECRLATDNRVPETEHWVCKKHRGMISQTIGFFRDTRVRWFKRLSKDKSIDERTRGWYTVVEKALKVFVNASYGVTGAQHFELFCMPAAESVTAFGRHAILQTKKKAESMGVRVLYGDTDSVFLDNPTKEQQEELVRWSQEVLGIDLEVEKTFKYVALSDRKKNYIGVYKSGHVEVKGLSGKKRNTPDFVQEAFRKMLEVLSKVDNVEGFEAAKEEIREIVNNVLDRLEGKTEPYSPEDLAFRVQMTKPIENYGSTMPQHVRAAKMLRDAGYDIQSGQLIEYIKTKDEAGVLPVQMAKGKAYWIDTDKYVDTLRSVFGQVLDAVGIDFDELLGFTTLDQFI
ncbi:MAG: DNA-directed DNA polymerase I [Candidatus Thorarchaeota archaeon]